MRSGGNREPQASQSSRGRRTARVVVLGDLARANLLGHGKDQLGVVEIALGSSSKIVIGFVEVKGCIASECLSATHLVEPAHRLEDVVSGDVGGLGHMWRLTDAKIHWSPTGARRCTWPGLDGSQ